MQKQKRILTAVLVIAIAVGFTILNGVKEAQASVAKPGTYRGKTVELQITGTSKSSKRSDFSTITFYNGKEYKKPAYRYIHIMDQYGAFMGFEKQPCCKKGKHSIIAWSGGSGAGGGQTCWAVITKKSAKKITLKVYWQNNMSVAMGETQPECILQETLKLIGS